MMANNATSENRKGKKQNTEQLWQFSYTENTKRTSLVKKTHWQTEEKVHFKMSTHYYLC